MEKIKAYIDKDNKYYALKKDVTDCYLCSRELEDFAFLILDYTYQKSKLTKSYFYFVCPHCLNLVKQIGEELQKILLLIVDDIPPGAVPSLFSSVGLKESSGLSVFDVAELNKLGGVTIDNTRYAGRIAINQARIGSDIKLAELEDYTNDFKSGLDLLNELKTEVKKNDRNKKK